MEPSSGGRAAPGHRAVGEGAQSRLRRRPLDLDRLALQPNGSNGRALVERHEGRAALAARVARQLGATMPAHLVGGRAVMWITAEMTLRGFSGAEIRAALPAAGIPSGRDRPDRKGRAPGAGRRGAGPEPKKLHSPEVGN